MKILATHTHTHIYIYIYIYIYISAFAHRVINVVCVCVPREKWGENIYYNNGKSASITPLCSKIYPIVF